MEHVLQSRRDLVDILRDAATKTVRILELRGPKRDRVAARELVAAVESLAAPVPACKAGLRRARVVDVRAELQLAGQVEPEYEVAELHVEVRRQARAGRLVAAHVVEDRG